MGRVKAARRLPRPPRPDVRAWAGLCTVLGLLSTLVWAFDALLPRGLSWAQSLAWEAARWQAAPWTWWTASLVHVSGSHLLANLLALAALAVLGSALQAPRSTALALLVAWPLSNLSLLLWPAVTGYRGLSGLIHAAVLALWAHAAVHAIARPLPFALLAGVLLKLATERAWVRPVVFDPDWGFNVVYAAHLGGAAAGAWCGAMAALAAWWPLRRAQPRVPGGRQLGESP